MRFTKNITAINCILACAVVHQAHAAALRKGANNGNKRTPASSGCVIEVSTQLRINAEDGVDDIAFECELDPLDAPNGTHGLSVPLQLDDNQKRGLMRKLESNDLVAGESTIEFKGRGYEISDNAIRVPPGLEISLGRRNNRHRRLAVVTGDKPILVVRVTDSTGKAVPQDAAQVGDDIFGTTGDPNNLKSQMYDCSFGQLNIIAGNPPTNSAGSNEVAPGVIEVTIPVPLDGTSRGDIRNAVTTAAQNKLGFNLPGPYQQVEYVLEGCYGTECGWAAYAYINSWNSVYQGNYYYMTGVQMHEIGHNFNFAHSGGLNGATYTDHTGLMGNPLYSDDIGKMCWNAAKTWQIGWYDTNKFIFDQSQGSWSGTLVGIADFNNNPSGNPVVIKLETGTSTDQYIAFNRATGVNSQNDEADNEVTIVETGANGENYSQSYLKATLVQGESFIFTNWASSGQDLTITAQTINIGTSPGYANVSICLGPCGTSSPVAAPTTSAPTPAPTTSAPTKSPTKAPTPAPTTSAPTKSPTKAPTPAPTTSAPTKSPTKAPTPAPTTSAPTKSPTKAPTPAPTTSAPTKATTKAPTPAPTTSAPTKAPIKAPTPAPTTSAPTKAPIKAPTPAPTTSAPTKSPIVTSAPTKAPTRTPTIAPTGSPTIFDPCKRITGGGACKKTSNCAWVKGVCSIASPGTGSCSSSNCGLCANGGGCKAAGCQWQKGICK